MTADELRRTFTAYFAERGHTPLPSMGLIPHHRAAPMFANAGMNQFLPVILGEEPSPDPPRATSIQKCVRVKGKHDDIGNVGVTWGHLTFFEMLGNFSFGDYFKSGAIGYAWELLTEVYGMDAERLWVTVHDSDDEAAEIWRDQIGVPAERIQRMGADNFWEMGETGPCGPCSEIYVDMGDAFGEPGGPAHGGAERYREVWNLVFMQYNRSADGTLSDLPKRIIDTGAGLERTLTVLQDVPSVFDTDELRRLIQAAEGIVGLRYGADAESDVTLRILADHGRCAAFLVNDGVFPSNEDRGYVLRRILRRAVRRAFGLGVERLVLPAMVESAVEVMGPAYPELVKGRDFILDVVTREEERFRQTLRTGSLMLDEQLGQASSSRGPAAKGTLPGSVAFRLHDTYGFPLELTLEIASERGLEVDVAGFQAEMEAQRGRARAAQSDHSADPRDAVYRELLEQFGSTEFIGYAEGASQARILALSGDELFLDRTPFYAESGGQVGDTGTIRTDTGLARVVDTTHGLPGLHRHVIEVVEGHLRPGQEALAAIDAGRRRSVGRNHTGTHLLHWALRSVLGEHVKQHGSLVGPERLRFDFSHFSQVRPDELAEVERLANAEVLANDPVRAYETTQEEARRIGALAFFGEKYGEIVRVVEAGHHSIELCGGTHVGALGTVGPIKLVSEGSIGSNLRRVEALTGVGSLDRIRDEEETLARIADLLRVSPGEVAEAVERLTADFRALREEMAALRRESAVGRARELAAQASDGVVVAHCGSAGRQELQDVATAVRNLPGVRAVVLGSAPEAGGVALVAAVAPGSDLDAGRLLAEAARTVGGGAGKGRELSIAGGRDASRLEEALEQARRAAEGPSGPLSGKQGPSGPLSGKQGPSGSSS
ncbi:MAG: alanine--tRNA ligase [Acidimicrobiales bacterium]